MNKHSKTERRRYREKQVVAESGGEDERNR